MEVHDCFSITELVTMEAELRKTLASASARQQAPAAAIAGRRP